MAADKGGRNRCCVGDRLHWIVGDGVDCTQWLRCFFLEVEGFKTSSVGFLLIMLEGTLADTHR